MRAERFGSYSIVAIVPGTPVLARRKSTSRRARLCPPPLWRTAMRPRLFRPPLRFFPTVRRLWGRAVVSSSKPVTDMKRRLGEVGLNCFIGMTGSPSDRFEVLDRFLARLEDHVRLLPVGALPQETSDPLLLAQHVL